MVYNIKMLKINIILLFFLMLNKIFMINPKVINKVKNNHENHKLKKKESTLDEDDTMIQNKKDEQNINQTQIVIFILFGILLCILLIIIYFFFPRQISYEQTKQTDIGRMDYSGGFFTCKSSENLVKYINKKLIKKNKKSSNYIFKCYIQRDIEKDLRTFRIDLYCELKNTFKINLINLPIKEIDKSSNLFDSNLFYLFSRFETTNKLKKVIQQKLLEDLKKTLNLNEISDEIKDEDVLINSDFYEEFNIKEVKLKKQVKVNLDN